MAYYRWSSSNWYIFWCGTESDIKDEQLLAVWYGIESQDQKFISYKELIENYDNVSSERKQEYAKSLFPHVNLSYRDLGEFDIAVKTFLADVENSKDKNEIFSRIPLGGEI